MKICIVVARLPLVNGKLTLRPALDRQCVTLLVVCVQNGRPMESKPPRILNTQLPIAHGRQWPTCAALGAAR